MSFGVYVHIPYCLQRCIYCDFATVETTGTASQIVPPSAYVDRVKKEISIKGPSIGPKPIDTIYFGGGTPSVLAPHHLSSIIETLKQSGFTPRSEAEMTLEINPGTLADKNIEELMNAGFNRFSVGVQSFDDDLLKKAGRLHSAQETRNTLRLLKERGVNYSADILFSMPTQTLDGLRKDLETLLEYDPPHMSPYCLTVPEGHPFSKGRAPEEEQIEMFALIRDTLTRAGHQQYEVSNFSKPGFESKHNLLYWTDQPYWGVGLSSHSYVKNSKFGSRFWNTRGIEKYSQEIEALSQDTWALESFITSSGEILEKHQSLTDYFHTALRMKDGLSANKFRGKFGETIEGVAGSRLKKLADRGLILQKGDVFTLTEEGILLSNFVFAELTFLPGEA